MEKVDSNHSTTTIWCASAAICSLSATLIAGRLLRKEWTTFLRYGLPLSLMACSVSALALPKSEKRAPVKWAVTNAGLLDCLNRGERIEQALLNAYMAGLIANVNSEAREERFLFLDGSIARSIRTYGRQLIQEEIDALPETEPALTRWCTGHHEKILIPFYAGPRDLVPEFEGKESLREAHFVLAVVDIPQKTVTVHDTLRLEGLAENIAEELCAVMTAKMQQLSEAHSPANNDQEWAILVSEETPLQQGTIECGVFVAKMAEAICYDRSVSTCRQETIANYREVMKSHFHVIPYRGPDEIALTLRELFWLTQDIAAFRHYGVS